MIVTAGHYIARQNLNFTITVMTDPPATEFDPVCTTEDLQLPEAISPNTSNSVIFTERKKYDWTTAQYGSMLGAFYIGYCAAVFPGRVQIPLNGAKRNDLGKISKFKLRFFVSFFDENWSKIHKISSKIANHFFFAPLHGVSTFFEGALVAQKFGFHPAILFVCFGNALASFFFPILVDYSHTAGIISRIMLGLTSGPIMPAIQVKYLGE